MRIAGFFWLEILMALIVGTGITLGYRSMPQAFMEYAPLGSAGAFLIVGLIVGSVARKSSCGNLVLFVCLLVGGIIQAAYVIWLYPSVAFSPEASVDTLFGYPIAYVWGGAALFGSLLIGLARARRKSGAGDSYRPSDQEARAFIEEHFLFLTAEELDAMSARSHGLVCSICRVPYTGKELAGSQWKECWVRCPSAPDHIFHARDFERAEWRCPVDKTLLYKPKFH